MDDSPQLQPQQASPIWSSTTRLVVAIFMVILFGLALGAFRAILVPLIIAGIMAYLLHPVVEALSRWTRAPYKIATAIIYLVLLAGVILLASVVTPLLVEQVGFLSSEIEKVIAGLLNLSTESVVVFEIEIPVQSIVDEVATAVQEVALSAARDIPEIAFGVAEALLLTVFIFLMAFYLTRDIHQIRLWFRGLVPPGYKRHSDLLLAELDTIWSAFFRGQLTLAIVVTVIITILASIIGMPQPLFWGLFAGLMEFLPSLGHAIYIVVAATVAFVEGSTTLPISNAAFVLVVLIAHTVFTQFDLNFLIPRIIGGQVHLHPMVVIIGIIIGASIGGVLGVALAAPVIASARTLLRYIYAQLFGLDPFPGVAQPEPEPDAQPREPLVGDTVTQASSEAA